MSVLIKPLGVVHFKKALQVNTAIFLNSSTVAISGRRDLLKRTAEVIIGMPLVGHCTEKPQFVQFAATTVKVCFALTSGAAVLQQPGEVQALGFKKARVFD